MVYYHRSALRAAIILTLFLITGLIAADPFSVDERDLFSDSSSLVDSTEMANPGAQNGNKSSNQVAPTSRSSIQSVGEQKSVNFSGNVLTMGQTGFQRDYFSQQSFNQTSLSNLSLADLFLDIRLQRGYKAFASLELSYNPGISDQDSAIAWRIPELFMDVNIGHKIYFRAGKQVLQWGRCFFFNPTDLINLDRNTFFRRLGSREGAYGMKVHVPFGAAYNLYGFLDLRQSNRLDSIAAAIKAEALIGRFEIGLMAWNKGHGDPVFGADLSTRLLGFDVLAEASLHQSWRGSALDFSEPIPKLITINEDFVPRAALGLGHPFDMGGYPNRITVHAEYFYNRPGITSARVPLPDISSALGQSPQATTEAVLEGLFSTGLYKPNQLSRHYAAVFATMNRFVIPDMTLTLNAIQNLNQSCAQISAGVAYRDLNDFSISFWVNGVVGPDKTEYTLTNQGLSLQVIGEIAF